MRSCGLDFALRFSGIAGLARCRGKSLLLLHGPSSVKGLVGCFPLEFATVTDNLDLKVGGDVIGFGDLVPLGVQEND